jgi:hypothetical protein
MRAGYREREQLLRSALVWLGAAGGEDAVMRAFGDPDPLDGAWELDAPDFRDYLRERCAKALDARLEQRWPAGEVRRGALHLPTPSPAEVSSHQTMRGAPKA